VTYCSRFSARGWVYDDGTLSIEAHMWVEEGGGEECAQGTEAGQKTVPCDTIEEDPFIECALLHHVRKQEVREYVAELQRQRPEVRCDDGTPLSALGAG
jgi:hypothetical protein